MKFDQTQKDALAAPLSRDSIKTREQSGRKLSYIEGWKAIAEANRIFGFDGWTRETVEMRCVSERERPIGKEGAKGWGVTYIARVRLTVGDLIREGCGTGHGIDRDLGQAHESALKEAETDAMKRAFMTFGNPFGLALYDKDQAEVENTPSKAPIKPSQLQTPSKAKQTAAAWGNASIATLRALNGAEVTTWLETNVVALAKLRTVEPAIHSDLVNLALRRERMEVA